MSDNPGNANMGSGPCPVVRVKTDNSDGFMEINKSDFDAEKHELYPKSGKDAAKKEQAAKDAAKKK